MNGAGAKFLVAILLLLSGSAAGAAAHRAPAVTKLELRRLPQPLATRRVLDQVADLLSRRSSLPDEKRQAIIFDLFRMVEADSPPATPGSLYGAGDGDVRQALNRLAAMTVFENDVTPIRHPRNPLSWYMLVMPYRASPYAGLCMAARFAVTFEPESGDRGAATPVRARNVERRIRYQLLDGRGAPVARKATASERAQAERDCAKFDPDSAEDHNFGAPNDRAAIEGAWLRRAVIAAAAGSGPLPFTLDCGTLEKAKCAARIAQLSPGEDWVEDCEPSTGSAHHCILQADDADGLHGMRMTITVDAADPQRILRVEAHETELVIFVDGRATD
jgi:hypothetical protein